MLVLKIPEQEYFDQATQTFSYCRACTLKLEHSLLSISKWEEKWKVPFLIDKEKTTAQFIDYIRCMSINPDVPDEVFDLLSTENLKKIQDYIIDPATATTVNDRRKSNSAKPAETPTAELIYYWMFTNGIPVECQKWRLNRLLTLIKIFNVKGNPQQMNKAEIYAMNAALNNARRNKSGSKG